MLGLCSDLPKYLTMHEVVFQVDAAVLHVNFDQFLSPCEAFFCWWNQSDTDYIKVSITIWPEACMRLHILTYLISERWIDSVIYGNI